MDRNRTRALFQGVLLLLITLCLYVLPAWAAPQPQDLSTLSSMEQSLYSVRYEKEPVEKRLSRLEETILGDVQASQSADARVATLKRVFSASSTSSNTPKTGNSPSAPSNSSSFSSASNEPGAFAPTANQQPSSESDYPTVTLMETKVLGQQYPGEEINKRLQRLEKQVFGTPQQGALVDRVDGLRLVVLGDTGTGPGPGLGPAPAATASSFPTSDPNAEWGVPPPTVSSSTNSYSPWYPSLPPTTPNTAYSPYPAANSYPAGEYSPPPVTVAPNSDIMAAIAQVEQQVLRKSYPVDPVDSRLARLETKIFHAAAPPTLSPEERLQRIIAVASAGGSSAPPSGAAMTMRGVLPVLLMLLPLLL